MRTATYNNMITLRAAGPDDMSFLWELHVASMRDYVDATYGWNNIDQKNRFDTGFQPAVIQIIELDGKLIGMWETHQQIDPWFLARIAIIPAYQSKGIGSALITDFLADADSQERQVALQVLKVNPAKALYERFGFLSYEETGTHFKMLRKPHSNHSPRQWRQLS
jgi:ribosomal protein S18 acetylase RimI-like enzyme